MGCNVSVLDGGINRKKGSRSSHKSKHCLDPKLEKPAIDTDKFDPRIPLTVRQKYSIMKSWKGIARNMQETGILMFLRYPLSTLLLFYKPLLEIVIHIYIVYTSLIFRTYVLHRI